MSKVIEMIEPSQASTLGQCEFCQLWFQHEDLFEIDDHMACRYCKNKEEDDAERKRIEEAIQDAMNQLPADQLMTFEWAFSFYYESLQDKSEVPDNIAIWLHRAKTALAFRSLQMKLKP